MKERVFNAGLERGKAEVVEKERGVMATITVPAMGIGVSEAEERGKKEKQSQGNREGFWPQSRLNSDHNERKKQA